MFKHTCKRKEGRESEREYQERGKYSNEIRPEGVVIDKTED